MICGPFGYIVATAFTFCLAEVTVSDGDTFRAYGQSYRLHIASAPERREEGGPEATASLASIIEGEMLLCKAEGPPSFGRYVVSCLRGSDGWDIGCLQVGYGHAAPDPRYDDGRYAGCKP